MNMHDPLSAAAHVQGMAGKEANGKVAMVMAGISVALLATMLIKEAKELFIAKDTHEHFKRWEKREEVRGR